MSENQRLSKITPDFESLHAKLRSKLIGKETWIDTLPTSVGTAILDLFAGMGTTYQYSAESAFREAFYESANRNSSIYAATRMLGNRIARKLPASVFANLVNSQGTTLYIVPYSKFIVDGRIFYNRVQLQIGPGQLGVNIPLYEGEPVEKVFDLSGMVITSYYEFFLDKPGFIVSDTDIRVYTKNKNTNMVQDWTIVQDALWEYGPERRVCFESTLGDGDMSLIFGDGFNGQALSTQEDLHVRHIITQGASVDVGLAGIQVRYTGQDTVEYIGETTSNMQPGSDEKDSSYYKVYNPVTTRSRRKAISKPALQASVATYPGVADATVLVQRDVAPYDLRWMNVFRICVLPDTTDTLGGINPNPKSTRWQSLIDFLEDKIHAAVQIQTWNPEKIGIKLVIEVGIYPKEDVEEIRELVKDNVSTLFSKGIGTLGKRLALSDIVTASKIQGVDYVKVLSPTEDIIPNDKLQYVGLSEDPTVQVFYSERVSPTEDVPDVFNEGQ